MRGCHPESSTTGFTDLIVITEQVKQPYIVIMSHLPQGPTATFRMTSLKLHKEIENAAPRTKHAPELNMKGFEHLFCFFCRICDACLTTED